jgi:ankyrin repeat protein
MRYIHVLSTAAALAFGLGLAAQPSAAQSSPAGDMRAPTIQPQGSGAESLPPALPGAGDSQSLNTAAPVPKASAGDPTTELFTAINAGDYSSAQDAVSRGADLNAVNALGETPLDLSVGLNRNSITFMLLAARNETSGDSDDDAPVSATPASTYAPPPVKTPAVPAKLIATPHPANTTASNNPGTPNPSAGFLGFGGPQ